MRNKKKRKLNKKGKFLIFLVLLIILGGGFAFGYKYYTDNKENKEVKEVEEKPKVNVQDDYVPREKRMSIVMVGDALVHGAVYMDAHKGNVYDFSNMFKNITPVIAKYDLKYYNQESIIGGGAPQHYPMLNTPDSFATELVKDGFNLVSLANNHSFDKGESGLIHSTNFWKKQTSVKTAGQYSSQAERDTINVYEQNGIKYSFLSYTMCTNGLSAPAGKSYYVNVYSDELVKRDVAKARENGAEVVMVAMHWGEEYTHVPTSVEKATAKYLSSLGVDLIIGSHPHVIQPIEYVGNTLVIYSLGNFISAQRVLGLEKVIGLMVNTDIVVKNGKVTFDKTGFELLYTYYSGANTNFKVIPFNKLNNSLLNNYSSINTKYRKIVDPKGEYNGN